VPGSSPMTKEPPPQRWPLYVLVAVCLFTAVIAFKNAVSWYGHPIAGMFVDPGGVVSNFGLPEWDGSRQGLKFPDVVVAADGKALSGGQPRARALDEAVDRAYASGTPAIEVQARSPIGVRTVTLRVHPLEPLAWWLNAGSLLIAGALYTAAGLIALWANPRSPLARTFAKLGVSSGLLIALTFDFHTTRSLAPLFFVAYAFAPTSWFALALRLPDDAPILRRLPWLERGTEVVSALVAGAFLFLYFSGRETRGLQQLWSAPLGGSFLFFAITFFVRFGLATGVRRSRLRALLVSVVPPHLVVLAMLFPAPEGERFAHLVKAISHGTMSLFPVATAFAFIRYDLWGSGKLLSRILTRLGVGSLVCVVAIGLGTAIATGLGAKFSDALLAATFSGAVAAVLVVAALAALDHYLFVARARYKPTVDELSAELISINSPDEVARAVERTIRRWLPCDLIELSLVTPASGPPDTPSSSRILELEPRPRGGEITLPVEFGGVELGSLRVGEKPGRALFTEDDVDLLHTIVNQGALALAHAYAYRELEERRREQAAAWRGERAALVETLAAEMAHEIRYPINFFRSIFEKDARTLDGEDVEIGREEVDRLERLVAGLKRMASSRVERRPVRILELCTRVEKLLRDALGRREIELAVPEIAEVSCDSDQMIQVLVNLVSNGLQAAGESGEVGIAWSQTANGAELVAWDSGPGFEGDGSKLFAPWYTTKAGGTGLGLAITHRLVRAHGWNIVAQRRDHRTLFVIQIRAEDIIVPEASGIKTSAKVA
jgi:two-component system sensor histidine kinase HydH